MTPEYLRNTASDAGRVIDYKDWQVPLGRRFRSLKVRRPPMDNCVANTRAHFLFTRVPTVPSYSFLSCPRAVYIYLAFRLTSAQVINKLLDPDGGRVRSWGLHRSFPSFRCSLHAVKKRKRRARAPKGIGATILRLNGRIGLSFVVCIPLTLTVRRSCGLSFDPLASVAFKRIFDRVFRFVMIDSVF